MERKEEKISEILLNLYAFCKDKKKKPQRKNHKICTVLTKTET